jgi:hypothetical protein
MHERENSNIKWEKSRIDTYKAPTPQKKTNYYSEAFYLRLVFTDLLKISLQK